VIVRILRGDALAKLAELPAGSVHCCVTSPPYFGLRDYGCEGQIGLEATPDAYVAELVAVFREVRRVLRDDGTLWLNIGDSYASGGGNTAMTGGKSDPARGLAMGFGSLKRGIPIGLKPKDIIGIPWMLAFALRADGWYLRQDIIWSKPNPMPESVRDRCTKAHEYIFLLSKSARYYYDAEAISESSQGIERPNFNGKRGTLPKPQARQESGGDGCDRMGSRKRASGDIYTAKAFARPQSEPRGPSKNFGDFDMRNKRSVWTIPTTPFSEAHFATFPPSLVEPCILAGCPVGGTVLDPFAGAGTTGLVADRLGRNAILIELNPEYAAMAHRRIVNDAPLFAEVAAP
jgi:DNA modification methylase